MENGIYVGTKVDKATVDNVKDIIKEIFKTGRDTNMDQSTIVEAIHMVGRITEVKNVTITNSSISGDRVTNVGEEG